MQSGSEALYYLIKIKVSTFEILSCYIKVSSVGWEPHKSETFWMVIKRNWINPGVILVFVIATKGLKNRSEKDDLPSAGEEQRAKLECEPLWLEEQRCYDQASCGSILYVFDKIAHHLCRRNKMSSTSTQKPGFTVIHCTRKHTQTHNTDLHG